MYSVDKRNSWQRAPSTSRGVVQHHNGAIEHKTAPHALRQPPHPLQQHLYGQYQQQESPIEERHNPFRYAVPTNAHLRGNVPPSLTRSPSSLSSMSISTSTSSSSEHPLALRPSSPIPTSPGGRLSDGKHHDDLMFSKPNSQPRNTPIRGYSHSAYGPPSRQASERGRPLPTPLPGNVNYGSSSSLSPSRPQSMPPQPPQHFSPQAQHQRLTQASPALGHRVSYSLSQAESHRMANASPERPFLAFTPFTPQVAEATNIPFAPPQHPAQARSRSLSPAKPNFPRQNSSPSPVRRALPYSPVASPDLSQLQHRPRSMAAPSLDRRGTVSEMTSHYANQQRSTVHSAPPPMGSPSKTPRAKNVRSNTAPVYQQQPSYPPSIQESESEYGPESEYSDSEFESADTRSVSTRSSLRSGSPTSPQFGIRDLPQRLKRNGEDEVQSPTSPKFGILDMPKRLERACSSRTTSSVSERKRLWEEKGSQPVATQKATLSMPPMRQPQPSYTDRKPSWSLPTADLAKHEDTKESATDSQTTPRKTILTQSSGVNVQKQSPQKWNATPSSSRTFAQQSPTKPAAPPGPHSHLSMALRLAARSLEEERGVNAVPPGYRGIGDDIEEEVVEVPHQYAHPPQTSVAPPSAPPPSSPGSLFTSVKPYSSPVSTPTRASSNATRSCAQPSGSSGSTQSSPTKQTFPFTSSSRPSSMYGSQDVNQARDQPLPTSPQKTVFASPPKPRLTSHTSSVASSHYGDQSRSSASPTKSAFPFSRTSSRPTSVYSNHDVNRALDDPPPQSLSRRMSQSTTRSQSRSSTSTVPSIQTPDNDLGGIPEVQIQVPSISLPGEDIEDEMQGPSIIVSPTPTRPIPSKSEGKQSHPTIPVLNFPDDSSGSRSPQPPGAAMPIILTDLASSSSVSTSTPSSPTKSRSLPQPPGGASRAPPAGVPASSSSAIANLSRIKGIGLVCGLCVQPIFGRIVSAMGLRWHPDCFKCCVCSELLEHVSAFEKDGRPYCHLDYHELFAPQCYHCKTPIIDERFITLDDAALGKRTYHEQHFFCAECGDPFLAPQAPQAGGATGGGSGKSQGITVHGDGAFDLEDDVGFTVFKGHPYCETCHVRLRAPRCKGCQKSIREGVGYEIPMDDDSRRGAVEALGGKWHWECFVCNGCSKPFDEPSFFQRDKKPFCEPCFSLILRNEI